MLDRDLAGPVVVGNTATATAGFDGRIDHVVVDHRGYDADRVATDRVAVVAGASLVSVGGEQTGVAAPWTMTGAQTRSGSFALTAPETPAGVGTAWAVATGLDEVGIAFRSWWWVPPTPVSTWPPAPARGRHRPISSKPP